VINIEETVYDTRSSKQTNEIGTNTCFKKKKGGKDDKVIEGFADTCNPVSGQEDRTLVRDPYQTVFSTNCERATWLFTENNFDKLVFFLNSITSYNLDCPSYSVQINEQPYAHRVINMQDLILSCVRTENRGTRV
jgi:hypothetical protein